MFFFSPLPAVFLNCVRSRVVSFTDHGGGCMCGSCQFSGFFHDVEEGRPASLQGSSQAFPDQGLSGSMSALLWRGWVHKTSLLVPGSNPGLDINSYCEIRQVLKIVCIQFCLWYEKSTKEIEFYVSSTMTTREQVPNKCSIFLSSSTPIFDSLEFFADIEPWFPYYYAGS